LKPAICSGFCNQMPTCDTVDAGQAGSATLPACSRVPLHAAMLASCVIVACLLACKKCCSGCRFV
jgi:hypothetical protein